ncbi:beta-catenin-like 1 [Crotalus adamanteus]|uniref:Beta-catenin-like protein 1 n=1 Tax=Crotalus adamanteus TaxID=8729 RepID=A0AAW1BSA8_CROAD
MVNKLLAEAQGPQVDLSSSSPLALSLPFLSPSSLAQVEGQVVALLVQNLERLDESVKEEADGVHNTLAIIENMAEFRPEMCVDAAQQGLMQWLLKRVKAKMPFDANKLYCSEVLAILLQNTDDNREMLGELDGIDVLLQQLSVFKRHNPGPAEEQEMMENLFDSLCSSLMLSSNRERFLKGEGLQLMNLMLREKKISRSSALKVLDHAMIGPEGADNCHKFVDILGLRTIFPLFMKSPKKAKKVGTSEKEHEGRNSCPLALPLFPGQVPSKGGPDPATPGQILLPWAEPAGKESREAAGLLLLVVLTPSLLTGCLISSVICAPLRPRFEAVSLMPALWKKAIHPPPNVTSKASYLCFPALKCDMNIRQRRHKLLVAPCGILALLPLSPQRWSDSPAAAAVIIPPSSLHAPPPSSGPGISCHLSHMTVLIYGEAFCKLLSCFCRQRTQTDLSARALPLWLFQAPIFHLQGARLARAGGKGRGPLIPPSPPLFSTDKASGLPETVTYLVPEASTAGLLLQLLEKEKGAELIQANLGLLDGAGKPPGAGLLSHLCKLE